MKLNQNSINVLRELTEKHLKEVPKNNRVEIPVNILEHYREFENKEYEKTIMALNRAKKYM